MKKRILIADSDEKYAQLLRGQLESAGYEIICRHEAVRVIESAHKDSPDLILLDWCMPTGRGSDVLDFLAKKDNTRKIPVIVVTSGDEPSMTEKSQMFKVKGIFYKPHDAKELLQKIKEVFVWKKFEDSLT